MKSKEVKPCLNDMCIKNEHSKTGCTEYPYIFSTEFKMTDYCMLYFSEKKESAWEMFKRLNEQYGYRCEVDVLIDRTEQEAIKIMQEIEKELEK